MDFIPINRLKISKDKWLQQKIKYEEELKVEDILDENNLETMELCQNL